MREIVYRFNLSVPQFDLFTSLSLLLAVFASLIFLFLLFFRTTSIFRLSIITAALLHVFFQWPVFIISDVLETSLQYPYWFFFIVQFGVFALLGFGLVTSSLLGTRHSPDKLHIQRLHLIVPLILGAFLVFLYLRKVPFDCTALFAVMFDPHVTLLAREVSIKFAGSFIATASYGAFANAVAPVSIAMSIAMIYLGARRVKPLQAICFAALIIVTVFICLMSGAKGLLVPSLIVILVSSLMWNRSIIRKSVAAAASILVLFASLVVFEVIRDRGWDEAGAYPYGQCSARLGACDQSKELILSLYERASSLGLFDERLDALRKELEVACAGQGRAEQFLRPETRPAPGPVARTYIEGIIYRALVIPTQVAAWHYLYVEAEGSPGFSALPFARRLTGFSVNMPELVYQKYGSVFSGGDRTSTSTSPTGFLLAYPAYLGFIGLVLALVVVMATDVLVSLLLQRMPNAIYPIGVGLAGVMASNFILSDYVTVMLSHGGGMAIALMAFFAIFKDHGSLKRAFDLAAAIPLCVLLAIPALVLAFMIRWKLGSPVLFRQPRPGLDGKVFTMLKFRTMTDARDVEGNLLPDADRLTRFGRWLRATSLDELPELINVIKGDMSLVGPRPLLPEYLPLYSPEQAQRHKVRPGITGWAQVNGRNAISWDEKFAYDVWYVENHSLLLDLKILFMTVGRVLSRKGVAAEGSVTAERFVGHQGARAAKKRDGSA